MANPYIKLMSRDGVEYHITEVFLHSVRDEVANSNILMILGNRVEDPLRPIVIKHTQFRVDNFSTCQDLLNYFYHLTKLIEEVNHG